MTVQVHTESRKSHFKKKNQNCIIGQLKSIHARWDVKNSHGDFENGRKFGSGWRQPCCRPSKEAFCMVVHFNDNCFKGKALEFVRSRFCQHATQLQLGLPLVLTVQPLFNNKLIYCFCWGSILSLIRLYKFYFPQFQGLAMYANQFKTKGNKI